MQKGNKMKITKRFKPNQIIDRLPVNGKEVIYRTVKMSDVDGCLKHINTLVKEKKYISMQKPISRKSESDWVKKKIKELKKGDKILVLAEVDGKIVGSAEVWRWPADCNRHISEVGITFSAYRGMGLGTRMMQILEKIARDNFKSKIMIIKYFEDNKIAEGLYKKMGFVEAGRISKAANYYGKYMAEVILSKELK